MADFKELAKVLFKKTKDFTVNTVENTKEKIEVTKNKVEIKKEIRENEKAINSYLLQAGKNCYDAHLDGKDPEDMSELFDKITSCTQRILVLRRDLADLDRAAEIELLQIKGPKEGQNSESLIEDEVENITE